MSMRIIIYALSLHDLRVMLLAYVQRFNRLADVFDQIQPQLHSNNCMMIKLISGLKLKRPDKLGI
ncbi:hypothetical protein [Nitrosomonas sp. Nm34]|uniref:hypothetical protein n=1 Tax=Nitrosomonas sp. Nm34 TaxID=1881055 RepID=UPI000A6EBD76|nr:hypothetical protein [Nitrosomonas sp. Nm34]